MIYVNFLIHLGFSFNDMVLIQSSVHAVYSGNIFVTSCVQNSHRGLIFRREDGKLWRMREGRKKKEKLKYISKNMCTHNKGANKQTLNLNKCCMHLKTTHVPWGKGVVGKNRSA